MSKVTEIRTIRIAERPNLLWVEIETDEKLTGLGESFRGAATAEAAIHEQIAPSLLGRDSREIEAFSHLFSNPYVGSNSAGAEMRAASAVDIALWDLHGKRHNTPIYNLMGGLSRSELPVYNTCAGYAYNSQNAKRRAVMGDERPVGPYDDQIAFMKDAGELARSLVDEGYAAMKIWPFDIYTKAPASHHISLANLKAGLEPFAKIRKAVGDKIDVMCELHCFWGGTASLRICQALEDYGVFWAEDPVCKSDDIRSVAALRGKTRTPICISETLGGLVKYRDALIADAVDYVMLDLAWCGGLTMAKKIAAMAEAHAKPVSPHDCTGPVVLTAGIHFAFNAPTAIFQEVVRAYMTTWYRDIVTNLAVIENGKLAPPELPGLGIELRPEVKTRPDASVRVSN